MYRDPSSAALGVILMLLFSLAVLVLLGRRHGVVAAATVAFGLRAVRGLQVQITGEISDAQTYDVFAVALVRYWQDQGPDPGSWLGKDGFPALLASIYSVVGHAPEVGYLLNALAGGLAVLVVAATTAQMGWTSAIKPSAWLVALWPVGFVWGGMLLREAIVTLLLAVGVWGTVRLYKLNVASGVAAILASGVAMIFMRGGLAFLILIGMPLTAAMAVSLKRKASAARWVIALAAIALALVSLSFLSSYFSGGQYFEYRAAVSSDVNTGTSSFAQAGLGDGAVNTSVIGHVLRIPVIAFGPFPWQISNLSLAIAGVDALLWLTVWILALRATWALRPRIQGVLFLLPAAALMVALAANSANFGLIIRLRAQGIVLLAPLAALGFVLWRDRRSEKREVKRQERLARRAHGRAALPRPSTYVPTRDPT